MASLTGEFITAAIANDEINQFLDTRDECYYHIMSKLQSEQVSQESVTYYRDNEISFIFDRDLIKTLFEEIDNTGKACNALRVYYAADPGKNGSTTVVLVGANYTKIDSQVISVENVFSADPRHAAIEYPGGGLRNIGAPHVDIVTDNLSTGNITIL